MLSARVSNGRVSGFAARLDLLGPMRLADAERVDHTPRSPHRQALLGVIALSGEAGVSRARLQDLFWGEKEPQLAAQSLRTALHGLRRDLSAFDSPIIEIDAQRVRLVPDRVRVDLLAFLSDGASALPPALRDDPPDLLEGIDLSAEGFEDWLREQRLMWGDRIRDGLPTAPGATPGPAPPPVAPRDLRPVVGLLAPIVHSRSLQGLYLGDVLLDRIADGLREYVGARVFDYRGANGTVTEDAARVAGPDLYLRFRLYELPHGVSLRVLVMRQSTEELLWSVQRGPIPLDRARVEDAEILDLLGEVIERVSTTLAGLPARGEDAPITPFHALTSMFQLEHNAMDGLQAALGRAWEATDAPIYPALLAYLNTFRVGEHWTGTGGALEDGTRDLIGHVRARADAGGLAVGLAGHSLGYVLHDHDGAGDMLNRAVRLAPQSAVCWDHLALHCTYGGRYDQARIASANALRIGAFSPIEFTMQTTRSMIATLQGDFHTATREGARVLSVRPKFGAALRYSAIGKAHLGDLDGAKACIDTIRTMDPEFSVDWVRQERMAVRDRAAKDILIQGLTRAGAT